ncbi:MAG TPA: hypothetical protein VGZ48_09390 [Candidatus Acidoferrales bacterium]|nr:hypothetical protein [Candidatus Acidoferrales bacterium]
MGEQIRREDAGILGQYPRDSWHAKMWTSLLLLAIVINEDALRGSDNRELFPRQIGHC